MRIVATSDLHGNLPEFDFGSFDLLLICGDICPASNHGVKFQEFWLKTEFIPWIKSLPYNDEQSKVVMVWGNHDFYGEHCSDKARKNLEEMSGNRLKILNHEQYDFLFNGDTISIWGTPYCSVFGYWAFMIPDVKLAEKFSQIPEGIDILISHDSPFLNKLGAITEGYRLNDTTGNKVLPMHIERVKPKVFLSGHFHSGNHEFKNYDGIWMANVSYVNEAYQPVNPLLVFDFDPKTKEVTYGKND